MNIYKHMPTRRNRGKCLHDPIHMKSVLDCTTPLQPNTPELNSRRKQFNYRSNAFLFRS